MLLMMMLGCGTGEEDSAVAEETNFSTTATTDGGSFVATYTTDPAPITSDAYFAVTLSVFEADGTTVVTDITSADIDAEMTTHGHGMNVDPEITDNGDGTFTATPFLFHMSGHWTIRFALTQGDITEEGYFDVECCD